MHELLGRREIGLPPAGAKTNELIAKRACERVCNRLYMYLLNISYDWLSLALPDRERARTGLYFVETQHTH